MCCAINVKDSLRESEYRELVDEMQGGGTKTKIPSRDGLRNGLKLTLDLNSNTVSFAPRAENAKIDVKVIGASQEMCNYLPLLQKLPAALVIRKVKVTKHSSRVSLREIFT